MTLEEAWTKSKWVRPSDIQPEGEHVVAFYRADKLDHETCLYLIAYLLHRVNELEGNTK